MEIRKYICLFFLGVAVACAQTPDPGNLGRIGRPGVQIDDPESRETQIVPSFSLMGTYTSGFRRLAVDGSGKVSDSDSYGVTGLASVAGVKAWRRTSVSLGYTGTFRHYNHESMDGIDQMLALGVTRQVSRRVEVSFTESAGILSRSYGMPGSSSFNFLASGVIYNDPNSDYVPFGDIFDTRSYFAATSADLAYYRSHRLSFGAGGTGFVVDRKSPSLAGVVGASARGDVFYQIDRRQGIGAQYSYDKYDYTGQFGTADVHSANLIYSALLNSRKTWNVRLALGGYRVESARLTRVALDPVVAALLGQRTGTEIFYGIRYSPSFSLGLSYRGRNSTFVAQGRRVAAPGNGIYLTSHQDLASVMYGRTLSPRFTTSVTGSYSRLKAISQTYTPYNNYSATLTFSTKIVEQLYFTTYASYRIVEANVQNNRLSSYLLGAGLTWSPSSLRLPIW